MNYTIYISRTRTAEFAYAADAVMFAQAVVGISGRVCTMSEIATGKNFIWTGQHFRPAREAEGE